MKLQPGRGLADHAEGQVLLSVVVRAIDLHNEVLFWQVEVHNAVVRLEKAVLEPIGKAERSEVGTEHVLRWGGLLSQLCGIDLVAFAER